MKDGLSELKMKATNTIVLALDGVLLSIYMNKDDDRFSMGRIFGGPFCNYTYILSDFCPFISIWKTAQWHGDMAKYIDAFEQLFAQLGCKGSNATIEMFKQLEVLFGMRCFPVLENTVAASRIKDIENTNGRALHLL